MTSDPPEEAKIKHPNVKFIWKCAGRGGRAKQVPILKKNEFDRGKEEAINYCRNRMLYDLEEKR
jgi:hypothetical protein